MDNILSDQLLNLNFILFHFIYPDFLPRELPHKKSKQHKRVSINLISNIEKMSK